MEKSGLQENDVTAPWLGLWWGGSCRDGPCGFPGSLAWVRWLLVSEADTRTEFSMPPPHGFNPRGLNYSDDCRQAVVELYDPDLIDEWSSVGVPTQGGWGAS